MKNNIVEQLLAKRNEIDRAIEAIEGAEALLGGVKSSKGRAGNGVTGLAGMSVYKSALAILEKAGEPLSMREIADAIISSGKQIGGKNPRAIISTTIYKKLATKNCEIAKLKTGKFGLKH